MISRDQLTIWTIHLCFLDIELQLGKVINHWIMGINLQAAKQAKSADTSEKMR